MAFKSISIITTALVLSTSANAALVERLGGLAYYDTDANLTWLADANAGAGSVFDDGSSTTDGAIDERTNEYVITIEYRVRRGNDSAVVTKGNNRRLINTMLNPRDFPRK